jgi:hypothetical protein
MTVLIGDPQMRFLVGTLLLLVTTYSSGFSRGNQIDTLMKTSAWVLFADAGLFPAANGEGVGWYPSYSVRAAIGRRSSILSTYLFLDYYDFNLSEAGGLHEYIENGAKRHDIAVYSALSLYRVFFIGAGFLYTHSDHVTITSILGDSPWTGGDINGIRLFCTVGLTWDIQLTENITLPFGLYYRNPSYYAVNVPIAIRAGMTVRIW